METNVIFIATVSVTYDHCPDCGPVCGDTKKYFKDEKSATDWALSLYTEYINTIDPNTYWYIEKQILN